MYRYILIVECQRPLLAQSGRIRRLCLLVVCSASEGPFSRIGVLPNAAKECPVPGLFVAKRSDKDNNHCRNGDRRAHGSAADHPRFVFFRRKKGGDKFRHDRFPFSVPPGGGSGYFIPEPHWRNDSSGYLCAASEFYRLVKSGFYRVHVSSKRKLPRGGIEANYNCQCPLWHRAACQI